MLVYEINPKNGFLVEDFYDKELVLHVLLPDLEVKLKDTFDVESLTACSEGVFGLFIAAERQKHSFTHA